MLEANIFISSSHAAIHISYKLFICMSVVLFFCAISYGNEKKGKSDFDTGTVKQNNEQRVRGSDTNKHKNNIFKIDSIYSDKVNLKQTRCTFLH